MAEEIAEETQPTMPPTSQTQSQLLKYLLFTLVGLLLLGGTIYAGYWYGTESSKLPPEADRPLVDKTLIPEIPTPTPTPTPPQTTSPTADWKTYKNEKYGISFKYPSSWFVKDVTNEAPGNFLQSIAFFTNGTTNPSVGAAGSEGNELLNLIIANPYDSAGPMLQSKEQFINAETSLLNQKIVYIDNLPAAYDTNSKSAVIWYNEKIQIYVNPYQGTENIMDQILSTFKFLE